jgi:hypothetical protein
MMDDAMQSRTASSLIEVLKEGTMPSMFFDQLLRILPNYIASESPDLQNLWANVYELIVCSHDNNMLLDGGMKDIFLMSGFSKPTFHRKGAALMVASLGKALGSDISEELIRKSITLAQDISLNVRHIMCANLHKILVFLDASQIEELWNDLVGLWQDDAWEVKQAAVGLLCCTIERMPANFVKEHFLNVFDDMLRNHNEEVMKAVIFNFGKYLGILKPIVDDYTAQHYIRYLSIILPKESWEFRYFLASNLTNVISLYGNFPALFEICTVLSTDKHADVKQKFEIGFPEICNLLSGSHTNLSKIFENLLLDPATQKSVLNRLAQYTKYLEITDFNLLKHLRDILSSPDWRNKNAVLSAIIELVKKYEIREFIDFFSETLIKVTKEDIWPVRCKSVETLAHILYHTYFAARRNELKNMIISSLFMSETYSDRILYITFVLCIRKICSRQYITDHFLDTIIQLGRDSVLDVRYKFAENFINIKEMLDKNDSATANMMSKIFNTLMDDESELIGSCAARVQKSLLNSALWQKLYSPETDAIEEERRRYEQSQIERERVEQEEYNRNLIAKLTEKARQEAPQPARSKTKKRITTLPSLQTRSNLKKYKTVLEPEAPGDIKKLYQKSTSIRVPSRKK